MKISKIYSNNITFKQLGESAIKELRKLNYNTAEISNYRSSQQRNKHFHIYGHKDRNSKNRFFIMGNDEFVGCVRYENLTIDDACKKASKLECIREAMLMEM